MLVYIVRGKLAQFDCPKEIASYLAMTRVISTLNLPFLTASS
jgi:hypothetical protein